MATIKICDHLDAHSAVQYAKQTYYISASDSLIENDFEQKESISANLGLSLQNLYLELSKVVTSTGSEYTSIGFAYKFSSLSFGRDLNESTK